MIFSPIQDWAGNGDVTIGFAIVNESALPVNLIASRALFDGKQFGILTAVGGKRAQLEPFPLTVPSGVATVAYVGFSVFAPGAERAADDLSNLQTATRATT